jgi:2-keto-4-pentenoate hydratase/2-oxohepta-3-ene-1,7-dioic acid hydratase in catechol pathway
MKLLHFRKGDQLRPGVLTTAGVIDIALAGLGSAPRSLDDLLGEGKAGLERLQAGLAGLPPAGPWLLELASLELGPCIAAPEKILCVGLNYRRHALESNLPIPETPVLFSKFNNTLAGPTERIPVPEGVVEVDYEVELGVVIGREARNVPEGEALDVVFGYCTLNDLSARDLQRQSSQWLLGKTPDKFLPAGPYLVTADEVPDPQNLSLRCWVNGDLRQESNTADMIFSVAEVISYASRYMTLKPGDLISTGTPEGVILGMKEKIWLKAGDQVVVEVEGLGRCDNLIK